MVVTLAFRNLVHDRTRLALTLIGIAVAIILVGTQMGLMLGFNRMISGVLDHAHVELWIVPPGTDAFDDPAVMGMSERYAALAVSGVETVTPVVVGFAEWQLRGSGTATVIVVGSDLQSGALEPWNLVDGNVSSLAASGTVAVDQAYASDLGVSRIGDTAKIEGTPVKVSAITSGIRSFTTSPYVFAGLDQARVYLGISPDKTTYLAVKVAAGADIQAVRDRIGARIKKAEVLTTAEFRRRNVWRWLFETGAGAVLLSGIILGLCVGSFIVAQTLYASINDHLKEFATLRAMGSSKSLLRRVVYCQAGLSAGLATLLATIAVALLSHATAHSALPILINLPLAALLVLLCLGMSIAAAAMTVAKVTRIQPVTVFAR